MEKAVILGQRQAGLVEVPDPQPKENWVLVKVHAAPMCTEYKLWLAGRESAFLGHEAAGEVVAVAQLGRVQVGDRVAGDFIHCQQPPDLAALLGSPEGSATYAQYLLKPDWMLSQIPDGVSYELASLACCGLGPTFGAFEAMGVDAFDTVLITGAGPVGLGGVVNAKFRGARVIVAEALPYRVERARRMRWWTPRAMMSCSRCSISPVAGAWIRPWTALAWWRRNACALTRRAARGKSRSSASATTSCPSASALT